MFEKIDVSTELDGRLVVLRFDHGKANEVGSAVLRDLEKLPQWLIETGAVALITVSEKVSSRGTPLFVAGADVSERVGWDDERVKEHVAWQRSVLRELRAAPVFHTVVVHGVALGWGTEYMLCCDWRIALPRASFALPETGLGIVPGAGGSSDLWAHIGVAQTLRLGMTGERIGPEEALRIGLVQELAPDIEVGMTRARGLADMVAKKSPTALGAFKAAVLASVGSDPSRRGPIEEDAYARCVDSGEAAIGRAHFTEIRAGKTPPWGPRG